jgi:hypothetical protein
MRRDRIAVNDTASTGVITKGYLLFLMWETTVVAGCALAYAGVTYCPVLALRALLLELLFFSVIGFTSSRVERVPIHLRSGWVPGSHVVMRSSTRA